MLFMCLLYGTGKEKSMEKVTILYESEPGIEGKCNAEVKGSPLDVLVGTAVIVCYISESIAKKNSRY